MRLFFSLAFLIGGICLCVLNLLAHAVVESGPAARYQKQMESVPFKETYTRAEVAEAVWQAWTNRVSLPAQSTYSVVELKSALLESAHVLGTQQESCDRSGLDYAIRVAAGYKRRPENGMTAAGVFAMLIGAFLLGTSTTKPKSRGENDTAA